MNHFVNHHIIHNSNFNEEIYETNLVEITLKEDKEDYKKIINIIAQSLDVHPTKIKTNLSHKTLNWLNKNVVDKSNGKKAWGYEEEKEFSFRPRTSMNIIFYRRKDARNFIKTFSKVKKPMLYFNYFTQRKEKLNSKNKFVN